MANSRKNPLAQNIPEKSSLSDVEKELGFKLTMDVKAEDATVRPEPKYDMDLGWHTVRAASLAKVDFTVRRNKFGEEYSIDAHYEIVFEDVKTGDTSVVSVAMTEKAENSFKRAINQRSGKDLGYKLAKAGVKLTDLDMKSVVRYAHKFPIQMLYDFSTWVDKDTGEFKQSKYPKLQLWVKEDFEDNTPKTTIELD